MRSTNGKKPAKDRLPLKRATIAEKEERVLQTMKLVVEGRSTSEIKQWFRDELDLQFNQALRYLRLARERLAEENGLGDDFTLQDMKVQHYEMAMAVARDKEGEETKDRLAALKHAGSIYGVQAPRKIAQTTPDGKSTYNTAREAVKDLSVEELHVLKKVRDKCRDLAAGRSKAAGN